MSEPQQPPSTAPPASQPRPFDPTREAPRTFAEADRYFQKVSGDGAPHIVLSPARARWVGVLGWAAGAVACGYMVLWADFGDREHVFSPVSSRFAVDHDPRRRPLTGWRIFHLASDSPRFPPSDVFAPAALGPRAASHGPKQSARRPIHFYSCDRYRLSTCQRNRSMAWDG